MGFEILPIEDGDIDEVDPNVTFLRWLVLKSGSYPVFIPILHRWRMTLLWSIY